MADDLIKALDTIESGPETPITGLSYTQAPAYQQGASLHNQAYNQSGGGWLSSIGQSISNAPAYLGLSAASAAIGLANTFDAVGSWITGSEQDQIDMKQWAYEYDSDLGKYYQDNKEGIDTVGWILGSIVPGLGGVKAVNLGQRILKIGAETGIIGKNMSKATGLLVPQTETYMLRAANTLAGTNRSFRVLESNTLKALASGAQQNVLEAAAFEAFALGANFKSSFYDNMEASDIALNAGVGVLLGGALGGLLSGFKITKGIKNKAIEFDKITEAGIEKAALQPNLPASSQAVRSLLNRETQELWMLRNQAGPQPGSALPEGITPELIKKKAANVADDILAENNVIRTNLNKMVADGNLDVANKFSNIIIGMPTRDAINLVAGADELVRVGNITGRRLPTSKGQGVLDVTTDTATDVANKNVIWNKLWGAGEGTSSTNLPSVIKLADRVKLSKKESIQRAVDKVADTFKHSPNRSVDVMDLKRNVIDIQSRYLKASKFKLKETVDAIEGDFPLLEAAYLQHADSGRGAVKNLRVLDSQGEVKYTLTSQKQIQDKIVELKDAAIAEGIKKKQAIEEIAERANVNPEMAASLTSNSDVFQDYFYHQAQAAKYNKTPTEMFYEPSYMGVKISDEGNLLLNDMELDAELLLAYQRDAAQRGIDNAVANAMSYLGDTVVVNGATGEKSLTSYAAILPGNDIVREALREVNRGGAGARLLTFSNGNYGTAESLFQYIGQLKRRMDDVAVGALRTKFTGVENNLRLNSGAAIELSVINEQLARMPGRYGLSPEGSKLIPLQHLDDIAAGRPLSKLREGMLEEIPINNPAAHEFIVNHIQANGERVSALQGLRASIGMESTIDPRSFYPVKPDPRKAGYHAFVKDPTITGAGHITMIHAGSPDQLNKMMARIRQEFPQWEVYTKKQSADYHKALGDYEWSKTLHDNYIDSALNSRGINSQVLPMTDPNMIADKFMNWHVGQVRGLNAEIIKTKYSAEFRELSNLGRAFDNLSEAKYADVGAMAIHTKDNPYMEYYKTALNISNLSDYPMLTTISEYLDSVVSAGWNRAVAKYKEFRGVNQKLLDEVNDIFEQHGFKTAYYDAATHLLANHPADSAVLSRFIRSANSILATTFLRADWLNAINNKVGSVILTNAELRHVIKNVDSGNREAVGKLADIAKVRIPGQEDYILSPTKLQARAYNEFFNRKDLVQQSINDGIVPADVSRAFKVIDDLSLRGDESSLQLGKKLKSAMEGAEKLGAFAEKWTGNKLIETLNRYVSWSVMRQITDVAIEAGVMTSKEARSYINTFVNRTQVTLNAAQRPLIFQGPIGMAMGLFQSYQFNLMQQLFRYVGEGQGKNAAYLMGLQGSFYGLNGLPGFQQFNEHIIGQASGNHTHNDIVQTLYGEAGYDLANFFLYGMPSNILQANLYSRGDLTPQNPAILPFAPVDYPFVSMYGKFIGNIKNVFNNIAGGANMYEALLQGIEHNGLSRPLAGLAQTFRGLRNGNVYSTDLKGNMIASNDLFTLATLARIAGGKPLDESIVRDEKFRIQAYKRADKELMSQATRSLRTSLIDSGDASSAQIDNILELYLNQGRKASDFNRFILRQYLEANTSDAEKIRNSLSDPYAYRMQLLMGGAEDAGMSFTQ